MHSLTVSLQRRLHPYPCAAQRRWALVTIMLTHLPLSVVAYRNTGLLRTLISLRQNRQGKCTPLGIILVASASRAAPRALSALLKSSHSLHLPARALVDTGPTHYYGKNPILPSDLTFTLGDECKKAVKDGKAVDILLACVQAACSTTASFCVVQVGPQVYAWGKWKTSGDSTMYPKAFADLQGWNVRHMAAGATHYAVAADESTITW